jgi:hypothetical protein
MNLRVYPKKPNLFTSRVLTATQDGRIVAERVGTTSLNVKIIIFWSLTSCRLVDVYECLGGMCCFSLQDTKANFKYYLGEFLAPK